MRRLISNERHNLHISQNNSSVIYKNRTFFICAEGILAQLLLSHRIRAWLST